MFEGENLQLTVEETPDIGVVPAGFVELFLVDDNTLKKSLRDQAVHAPHYGK
jgi:hypothetical protein